MIYQKGQALIESLFSYILIFLISFSVVEVIRLQSFKFLLQSSVNYYSKYIAFDEMSIIKNESSSFSDRSFRTPNYLDSRIKEVILNDLSSFKTSLVSFDENIKVLNKHNVFTKIQLTMQERLNQPPGVYLKATVCLPVLFSSFLNKFISSENIIIGRSIKQDDYERNCLGEFIKSSNTPKVWFRIRVAAYSPWPASTQIFYHGVGIPQQIKMMDKKTRQKFQNRFDYVRFDNVL